MIVEEALQHHVWYEIVTRAAEGPGTELARFSLADAEIAIRVGEDETQPFATVLWEVRSARASVLTVSPTLLASGRINYIATRTILVLSLVGAYHAAGAPMLGATSFGLEDYTDGSGLSFCSARPDEYLIPDVEFTATRGYADFQAEQAQESLDWPAREPRAFWRGSTTGMSWAVGGWQNLPRLRLCAIAGERPDLFDVGVSAVAQIEMHAADIEALGFMRPRVPAAQWGHYRYQIDIDGNSNAWAGFFQRLLTGSPVLKVGSDFRQWFYHRLLPWRHYVPVAGDMSDLIEKVEWLNAHETVARLIGEEGRAFARAMTYEREMALAVLTVSTAIKAGAEAPA